MNHGLPGWSQRRSVRRSSAGTPSTPIITMPGSCIPNSSTRSVLEVDDRAATAAAHSVRAYLTGLIARKQAELAAGDRDPGRASAQLRWRNGSGT